MIAHPRLEAIVAAADRLLANQHVESGLLPASTAVSVHGDYRHAWVRDNVYSILGPYAVGRALKRLGSDHARYDDATRRLMRGLLKSMMAQGSKVERFIVTGAPMDAIHAKFDAATGAPVCGDADWGHAQLDATGLFLLFLARFERAGLGIAEQAEEARFVRRLMVYAGRAFKTPDFGIWERGHKSNNGKPERNASSIGMCLAGLRALDGLTLAGVELRADPNQLAELERALFNLLPAECGSRSSDAALLSITGFPAFAIRDREILAATEARIEHELKGEFGYKRFLEDGHQTVIEDHSRLHYTAEEMISFRGIECEWPLFFTFRLATACVKGDMQQAAALEAQIEELAVDGLLPELYVVPDAAIAAEKAAPGSTARVANHNLPLWWAQSLWMCGQLMLDGLIEPGDLM